MANDQGRYIISQLVHSDPVGTGNEQRETKNRRTAGVPCLVPRRSRVALCTRDRFPDVSNGSRMLKLESTDGALNC